LIFRAICMKILHMSYLERRHYRLLSAIHVHGQLSQAARSVGLTQSAASHQIREAERRLGIRLFARAGRTLVLTAAGLRLVQAAQVSEAALAEAEAEATWLDRGAAPRLRVAVGAYDTLGWLPAAARRLQQSTPAFDLEIVRCAVGGDLACVTENLADVAIAPASSAPGHLARIDLFADPLAAVCAPRHAWPDGVTADVVGAERYLTYSHLPERGFEYDGFFRPAGVYPANIHRLESVSAVLRMIAADFGVSVLPRWMVADASDVLIRSLEPAPPEIEWAVYLRRGERSELGNAIDLLIGSLADSATE